MTRIAWRQLMHLGLHRMGLVPDQFWALTPAELILMAGGGEGGHTALTRSGLERLVAQYPDEPRSSLGAKD